MIRLPDEMTERDAARYLFASEYINMAAWRQREEDGTEGTPLLDSAEQRQWYIEHWMETHPEA